MFENTYRIKDLVNSAGQKIWVKNYYSAAANEKQKRNWDIEEHIQNMDEVERPEVTYVKGKICIDGEEYTKRVSPPDPTTILQMDPTLIAEILQLPMKRSKKIQYNENVFIGYTTEAADYDTVQKAYMNVKLNNAGARHIVAAWSLPGLPIYERQDFCDDQEVGFGRYLLSILQQNSISHRAVFVARYTNGEKIAEKRKELYYQAVQQVVNRMPMNLMCNQRQEMPKHELFMEQQAKQETRHNRRTKPFPRGRGRGGNAYRGSHQNAHRGGFQGGRNGKQNTNQIPYKPKSKEVIEQARRRRKERAYDLSEEDPKYQFNQPAAVEDWGNEDMDQ